MSQYLAGTANVTNGSATVTGTNTLWLANVTAGDSFTVAGDGVMYYVASVDTDTQVTLSVAYAGATASGAVYAIGTSFTVPDSFPEMSQGDIETATIFTRAMRKIQSKFTGIAINTTAEIGQAVSDHVALPDPHTQYAELSGGASANFTAMPQVGGDPIVESGSNSNGEYIKFADGTLISIATRETSISSANWSQIGSSGIYKCTIGLFNHPINFSSTPSIYVSGTSSANDFRNLWFSNGMISSFLYDRAYNPVLYAIGGVPSSTSYAVKVQAIGRWF